MLYEWYPAGEDTKSIIMSDASLATAGSGRPTRFRIGRARELVT